MTSDREAEGLAVRFMEMGYHAAVLRYSTVPDDVFPDAFIQAAACMKMLRERAEEWFIDPDRMSQSTHRRRLSGIHMRISPFRFRIPSSM